MFVNVWRDQLLHLLSCILRAPATVFPPSLLVPLSYISSSVFLPPVFLYSFSTSSYIPHQWPSPCIFPEPSLLSFSHPLVLLSSFLSVTSVHSRTPRKKCCDFSPPYQTSSRKHWAHQGKGKRLETEGLSR